LKGPKAEEKAKGFSGKKNRRRLPKQSCSFPTFPVFPVPFRPFYIIHSNIFPCGAPQVFSGLQKRGHLAYNAKDTGEKPQRIGTLQAPENDLGR